MLNMAAAESTIVEIQELSLHQIHDALIERPAPEPSLQQILDALPNEDTTTESFTIYRVPAHIRESRKIYFQPRIVSIGPYHHGKPHLLGMEKHKALFLRAFLLRYRLTMESCLGVVKPQLPRVKSCYFDTSFKLSDDKFAEMLLLDACFILEFLLRQMEDTKPFGNVTWMKFHLKSDLLMLENQIPFFVLQSLFDHGTDPSENALVDMVVSYITNRKVKEAESVTHTGIHHILHVYHSFKVSKPGLSVIDKKPLFVSLGNALKSVAVAATSVTCFRKKKQEPVAVRRTRTAPSASKIRQIGQLLKKKLVAAGTAAVTY